MICSYRLSKYWDAALTESSPQTRTWTSFSDVGTLTNLEEYSIVEDMFITAIVSICRALGAASLTVRELEIVQGAACNFHEGQVVDLEHAGEIARQILRELAWAKRTSDQCEVHFGYDYYVYIVSYGKQLDAALQLGKGLRLEPFISPYFSINNQYVDITIRE